MTTSAAEPSTVAFNGLGVPVRLRESRALHWLLLTYPVWWILGAVYFVWPLLTLPLLTSLVLQRRLRLPKGFSIWLFFVGWMLLSVVELDRPSRAIAFTYRASIYLSATVLFLWVYNQPRTSLSASRVARVLSLLWIEVAIGGLLGVLFPRALFHSPVEAIFPQSLLSDQTIRYFVEPSFSEVSTYFGYTVYRPKVLFAYTNQWGGCFSLLLPFVLATLASRRRGLFRWLVVALLIASLVPLVSSLDRGAWIGILVGAGYVGGRLLFRASPSRLFLTAVLAAFAFGIVAVSPLGRLVDARVTSNQNSNSTRASVYVQAWRGAERSPLLGYGSPRPDPTAHSSNLPHIGTQGQYPLVLFSNGFPALAAFIGWFAFCFMRSRSFQRGPAFWANAALLVGLVEMPYYDYMPASLHVLMVAAALALRESTAATQGEPRALPLRRCDLPVRAR